MFTFSNHDTMCLFRWTTDERVNPQTINFSYRSILADRMIFDQQKLWDKVKQHIPDRENTLLKKYIFTERGHFILHTQIIVCIAHTNYCLNSSECLNSIVWISPPEPLVESWGLKITPNESLWCACCRATVKTAIWALWKNCLNSFWLDQLSE